MFREDMLVTSRYRDAGRVPWILTLLGVFCLASFEPADGRASSTRGKATVLRLAYFVPTDREPLPGRVDHLFQSRFAVAVCGVVMKHAPYI